MTVIDRIRADLVAEIEHHQAALHLLDAQIEIVDRIIAAQRQPEPRREPPRNLRVVIYHHLTGTPQSVENLCERIGRCKRWVIEGHLNWHLAKGTAAHLIGKGWYRPDLPDLRTFNQALAEAAE